MSVEIGEGQCYQIHSTLWFMVQIWGILLTMSDAVWEGGVSWIDIRAHVTPRSNL